MSNNLDKDTLYIGVSDTSLVVKYFSEEEGRWRKNSRSFRCAGRGCAGRTVRDLSELVVIANGNISSFEPLRELEFQEFFREAMKRSYDFYVEKRKGGQTIRDGLLS